MLFHYKFLTLAKNGTLIGYLGIQDATSIATSCLAKLLFPLNAIDGEIRDGFAPHPAFDDPIPNDGACFLEFPVGDTFVPEQRIFSLDV